MLTAMSTGWAPSGLRAHRASVAVGARSVNVTVAGVGFQAVTTQLSPAEWVRRGDGPGVDVGAVTAWFGVDADGFREILGVATSTAESGAGWNSFLKDLVARRLSGAAVVTSDAHAGLVDAIGANLPGASWQRRRTHYAANLMSVCPKHAGAGSRRCCTACSTRSNDAVDAQYDKLIDQIESSLPDVHAHLDAARDEVLAFTAFPKAVWRHSR